jgi:hypothetical protein
VKTTSLQTRMRRLFTEAFTVMDIAEPLISFDAPRPADEVGELMEQRHLRVVGVRDGGTVTGYVRREDLTHGTCGDHLQPFTDEQVVAESSSFPEVLAALEDSRYCFVSILNHVGAIVSRTDIQKPPVHMWLFGMITILEMFCVDKIHALHPDGQWRELVPEGRLRRAEELAAERRRRQHDVELLDCLQLTDKAALVLKNAEVRADFGFESKRAADRAAAELQALRNNLAHAQDIVSQNWDTIQRLGRRLEKIVSRI